MGRRRKNDDAGLEVILKLGALAGFLAFLHPGTRSFIISFGAIAVWVVGIALVVILGFLLFQKLIGRKVVFIDQTQTTETTLALNPYIKVEAPELQVLTATSLVEKLRTIDWFQFEKLVALVYELQGFRVSRKGGANPDGGIDLVILKDGIPTAIQCKQWKAWNVGVKPVREFLGALTDAKIERGIFITLNGYTGDAKLLADKHGIEIINETGLTAMMERLNLSTDPRVIELLNDTRKFCPKCEREMILRTAGKGLNAGNQFWGCSGYPKCRFTMQMNG